MLSCYPYKKVAWNAFAILDRYGQKGPSCPWATKDLVDSVMTATAKAGVVISMSEHGHVMLWSEREFVQSSFRLARHD